MYVVGLELIQPPVVTTWTLPRTMDVSQSSQTSLPGARAADVSNSGPLPLYDLHLRVLNDSYIALFNERCVYLPSARNLVGHVRDV